MVAKGEKPKPIGLPIGVVGQQYRIWRLNEAAKYCTKEGESPVVENSRIVAESRVAWGTRNPM